MRRFLKRKKKIKKEKIIKLENGKNVRDRRKGERVKEVNKKGWQAKRRKSRTKYWKAGECE
jgi:hypothetical protein